MGRKRLMIISEVLMGLCLLALELFFAFQESYPEIADDIGWLPITALSIYIMAFCLGAGDPNLCLIYFLSKRFVFLLYPICIYDNSQGKFAHWVFTILKTVSFRADTMGLHGRDIPDAIARFWLVERCVFQLDLGLGSHVIIRALDQRNKCRDCFAHLLPHVLRQYLLHCILHD